MLFFFSSLDGVISVPNGADLSLWLTRVSPGQTLLLATNGAYTLGDGAAGFSTCPSGTSTQHVTINGNGATITGGTVGINLLSKSYIDFLNIHLRNQTSCCVQPQSSHHITFTDCTFASTANPAGFVDVTKNRICNNIVYTRCHIYETLGVATCDGFEFWDCDDCTCIDCSASGLHNGPLELNNGHAFEIYGENAGEACTNIQYIRCHAEDCRCGFTVESPNGDTLHTAFLTDCTSTDMEFFDYNCEAPGVMTIVGYDGGTLGGNGTINHD